ncbi:MAG: hypothetical protein ACYSTI_14135 [Planctomycetota bacterium]|jgi:hypothetical protein
MNRVLVTAAGLMLFLLSLPVTASASMSSTNYAIPSGVLAGGGGAGGSTNHDVTGALGQSIVGSRCSPNYTQTAGFWNLDTTVICNITYPGGDDGTNPGGGDNIPGVARSGGGNDSNNLVGGKPNNRDVEYKFSILFKDDTGESPQVEPRLYLAHRSSPTEGPAGDFFRYDLTTCTGTTWGAGKTCTLTLKLGPAAVHKFYFYAKRTDGTDVRLPEGGYNDGPVVEMQTDYGMVSAVRDINSQNLGGSQAFNSTYTYRWVSGGLDIVPNVEFNGAYELVTTGIPAARTGEGYFVLKNSTTLPELASSGDITADPFTYTLQAGWNIISNPYNGNVKLSDVQVRQGSFDPVSWSQAATNGWVFNGIYLYDGSDLGDTYTLETAGGIPDAELVPWLAYWIYLQVTGDTYILEIPKPAQ